MDKLVNELTQKDENKALKAAKMIIEQKNIQVFKLLCDKSDFLFDFVKNNVCKRLKKVINQSNYRNIISFFDIYNEDFSPVLVEALSFFADEDLTDEIYELLENGSLPQKKCAAKYFQFIPDTVAKELLEKNSFVEDIELCVNSAQALGKMGDESLYNSVIQKLNTNDEFELIKNVRFLSAYGDKKAVEPLLNILDSCSTSENIAGEIPYLEPFTEMFNTQNMDKVLTCFDFVLSGLGEIFNLNEIFFYEVYDVLDLLISEQNMKNNSHIAQVLLRALDKFTIFNSGEEYFFDETKDTKEELNAIWEILNSQSVDFWHKQKSLISGELNFSKQRVIAALETIQALKIKETKDVLIEFINRVEDEQLIVLSVGVAKSIESVDVLDFSSLAQKVLDSTLKAILNSYVC